MFVIISIIIAIMIVIYKLSGLILMIKYADEIISMDEVKYAYRDFDIFSKMVIMWPKYLPIWRKIRKDNK